MSIMHFGWVNSNNKKYCYDIHCNKCGWIVSLHEPHIKTHPSYGPCYFYHEWCYE